MQNGRFYAVRAPRCRCRAKVLQASRWQQRWSRPNCPRQERCQFGSSAKSKRHPQIHGSWSDHRYRSIQISQQYRRTGSSLLQADHTAYARLQSIPFCSSNVSWDRNRAYDPQGPASPKTHLGIQAVRGPRSINTSREDRSSTRRNLCDRTTRHALFAVPFAVEPVGIGHLHSGQRLRVQRGIGWHNVVGMQQIGRHGIQLVRG